MAGEPTKRPAKTAGKAAKPRRRTPAPAELAAAIPLPESANGGFVPVDMLLKYQAFAAHYVLTGNATQATREAGFEAPTEDARRTLAHRLTIHPDVIPFIQKQVRAMQAKIEATTERVWEELSYLAFLDPAEVLNEDGTMKPLDQIPERARRAIAKSKVKVSTFGEDSESVEREVSFASKENALERLMRLLGMLKDTTVTVVTTEDFMRAIEEGRERARRRRS